MFPWKSTKPTITASSRIFLPKLRQIIVILLFLSSLVGAKPPSVVQAASGWTAYNDCVYISGQPNTRVTTIKCSSNNTTGTLKKYADGSNTPVTLKVTISGSVTEQTGDQAGVEANAGTDAANTFSGIVSSVGNIKFSSSSSGSITLAFSGLDASKTYTFATTANRASADYTDRISKFVLQDATTAVNASTSGVTLSTTTFANDTASYITGYNTVNGYVVRWTGIQPGADKDFAVQVSSTTQAYGPAAFLLQEEEPATPAITVTNGSALTPFSSQTGAPSAEQSYTVSGSSLTDAILITAPADFEISTTSGSGFASSLTLPQTSGSVPATPIYVRFNRASDGSSSGSINHTSNGATAVTVPVSGVASSVPVCYALTLTHSGNGANPVADPANSGVCPTGEYLAGETITLKDAVPDAGWQITGWTGTRNDASTEATNSLVMPASATAASVLYSAIPNRAPDAPVLVQPGDGAGNVGLSPDLQVTAADPDGSATSVTFFGRATSGGAGADFTLVTIPDTQNEAQYYTNVLNTQFQWIADNKASRNIVFATGTGDIVNTANDDTQWKAADAAYDRLDAAGIPYSVGPGNHDMTLFTTTSLYNTYFGVSRYSGKPWYGGHYGSDNYNSYSLFSAGGMDFLLINLQYNAVTAQLDWADTVLKQYSDRRAIVVQHDILNTDNSWANQTTFNALRDNPNLFLMLCGHMHAANDGAAMRTETGTDSHTIYILESDYQDYANGGNGYLRLMRFSPADDQIHIQTYSPPLSAYLTDSQNQFDLAYAMPDAGPFETLGTVDGVASGADAVLTWTNRSPATGYEWYAVASDGSLSTQSPTWRFTTTAATNTAPVIGEGETAAVNMSDDGVTTPFNLTLHASDADGDPLIWSIASQAAHGTAALTATDTGQVVTFAPVAGYLGGDSFIVKVEDGRGGTDSITVNVTITKTNHAPVADDQAVTVSKNTSKAITLTGSDVDGDPLTFTLLSQPANGLLSGSAPAVTYNPNTGFSGQDAFTFKVSDGKLDSAAATVHLDVSNASVPPLPSSFYGEIHILDTPPHDGDLVSAYVPGIDAALNTAAITTNGANLTYRINVSGDLESSPAKDGGVENDVVTFKIGSRIVGSGVWHTGGNVALDLHPPQALPGGPYTVDEGAAVHFSASANDWGSDAATYQWDWDNNGSYDENGASPTHTWMNQGSYPVNLKVSDAQGGEGFASLTVAVQNAAPVLAAIGSQSVNERATLTFKASAADLDTLTYSLVGAPGGAAIDADSGVFTWTPTEEQGPNSYQIMVKVCDNGAPSLCDSEDIPVTVNEVNTAPTLAAIGDQNIAELNLLSFTAKAADADLPANGLTYSLVGAPGGAAIDADSGAFTWTPTEAQGPGSYPFTVKVCDSGAPALCDSEDITVAVSEVNAAPALAAIGDKTVAELSLLSFTAKAADADLPANGLTYTLIGAPGGAAIDADSGAFTWTPSEEQGPGSYPLTVKACDNGAPAQCDSEDITLTVSEVNSAPVLTPIGNKSVAEQSPLAFTASAADSDRPANNLTFSLVNAPTGASIQAASGAFSWTPTSAQGPADYPFTVKVCDNGAPALCDEETITVTVNETSQVHSIALKAGWNLVSFNLQPEDASIASVLSSVAGHYDLVYAWDASGAHADSGNWLKYAPNGQPYQNSLSRLDAGMGFWIHMTAADTLKVTGHAPTSTQIALVNDAGGWNLVGYPSAASGALPAVLQDHGVGADFTLMYAYHAEDASDPWKLYDPTSPDWVNDLSEMTPGWGYWVFVKADHSWTVAYPAP
jgi:hypothetical protein